MLIALDGLGDGSEAGDLRCADRFLDLALGVMVNCETIVLI